MAFDNITTAELSVGKPITNELMEKFKNRDDFLNAQVGTLDSLTISNPSFEVDSDGDGHPDNWTETFFTGGTGIIDTALSVHGAQSYKFTHPGGAGNGGGQIESDFFSVSTMSGYLIEYSRRLEGGAVPRADVINYNRNQSTVSEAVLTGSSSTGSTGTWTLHPHIHMPSSDFSAQTSITYIKLRLVGGTTDHSTAGTVNFDNITITELPLTSAGNYTIDSSPLIANLVSTASTAAIIFKIAYPGHYRFTVNTTSTQASNGVVSFFTNGTLSAQSTFGTGLSTHTFDSTRRLTLDDEIKASILTSLTTSVIGSRLKGARVSVENPLYGRVAIHVDGLTSAAT